MKLPRFERDQRMTDSMTAGAYSIGSDLWPGTSKLIEEMGELGQVLGKLIALNGGTDHWDGTDLAERLDEEIADVLAAIGFFVTVNGLSWADINLRADDKKALFHRWQTEQEAP